VVLPLFGAQWRATILAPGYAMAPRRLIPDLLAETVLLFCTRLSRRA